MGDTGRLARWYFALGFAALTAATLSLVSLFDALAAHPPSNFFEALDTAAVALTCAPVIGAATWSLLRQTYAGHKLRRRQRRLPTFRIGGVDIVVTDDHQLYAYCVGLLRPRIVISRRASDTLGGPELCAVLAHEVHHARNRDPLRLMLARVLRDGLFFLPPISRLYKRLEEDLELRADAAAACDRPAVAALASALLEFDTHGAGISPERVDHLLGDAPRRWEPLRSAASYGAATIVLLLVGATLLAASSGHSPAEIAVSLMRP